MCTDAPVIHIPRLADHRRRNSALYLAEPAITPSFPSRFVTPTDETTRPTGVSVPFRRHRRRFDPQPPAFPSRTLDTVDKPTRSVPVHRRRRQPDPQTAAFPSRTADMVDNPTRKTGQFRDNLSALSTNQPADHAQANRSPPQRRSPLQSADRRGLPQSVRDVRLEAA